MRWAAARAAPADSIWKTRPQKFAPNECQRGLDTDQDPERARVRFPTHVPEPSLPGLRKLGA
jgi:hypothetical protein